MKEREPSYALKIVKIAHQQSFGLLLSNCYCLDIELLLSNHYCIDIELLLSNYYCLDIEVLYTVQPLLSRH